MQNIPTITRWLLIINVVAYLLSEIMPGMENLFALHYWQATHFHIYQFVSYMFMHGGLTHLFFNMFALWMFGCVMERTWGQQRFLIYYMVCGIGAGIVQELVQFTTLFLDLSSHGATIGQILRIESIQPNAPMLLNAWKTVGASGSIYGILLAFGMTYPEERMFIFPLPVPVKAKWFVIGYAALEVFLAFSNNADGVAHMAHLGGMLFGFFLIRHWRRVARAQQSNFNGWNSYSGSSYDRGEGATILSKIKKMFKIDRGSFNTNATEKKQQSTSSHQQDWDYNAQKRKEEDEIDIILDKIRRSGYSCLSEEEKRKLFEASKK